MVSLCLLAPFGDSEQVQARNALPESFSLWYTVFIYSHPGSGRESRRWTALASRQGWARIYDNVSLIECESKDVLDDLLNLLNLGRFVVARVSERAVLVDGQQKAAIARALARRGHPHRITDLPPWRRSAREQGG